MILNLSLAYLLTALSLMTPSVNADRSFPPGVLATGTMGPTNPPMPTIGTPINQSSEARLLSVNSVDDFCLFAPPSPNQTIGDTEAYEVAWCTKPRNNARVIPDKTISGVSFLKTDFYVQLIGFGDLTKLNIAPADSGGELDPHGAEGLGNPVGGNVTTNITGEDESFAEWIMFIDNDQFCFRICTNANSTYSAANMCRHELDLMGCEFVLPGNYQINNTFETCDADVAYPPGWYPTVINGTTSFSTFAQRFTGTVYPGGSVYTLGDTSTPNSPYSTPKSSNCVKVSTISNGIPLASLGVTGGMSVPPSPSSSSSSSSSPPSPSSLSPSPVMDFSNSGVNPSSSPGQSSSARRYDDGGLEIVLVASWAVLAGIGGVVLLA